jgi:hypothetical protein
MLLELGLLCNVYLVYLLLRRGLNEHLALSAGGQSSIQTDHNISPLPGAGLQFDLGFSQEVTDYTIGTRRVSELLMGRITNLVLISQLIFLIFWYYTTYNLNLELFLFDGLIVISNNSLLQLIIVNSFVFISFQLINLGLNVSISGETCLIILANVIGIN